MLVKKILDWNEEQYEEIDVIKDKHPYLKAFSTGVINGYIDTSVILYPIIVVACYYWRKKAESKE